jgi:hypothetical protein
MAREKTKTILDNLKMTMTPFLVGDGKPLVELEAHVKTNFEGKSPVGVVTRGKSRIRKLTVKARRHIMIVDVNFFVLRQDPTDSTYTDEDAEYAISACMDSFLDWLEYNTVRRDLGWQNITSEQDTFLRPVVDDAGNSYWMETIMLEVETY